MTTVDQLDGSEGGIWLITTQGSTHLMDLDAMTVTRQPGPTSSPSINDTARPIRHIRQCQVGESGYWSMYPDGGYLDPVDFYWHVTTVISSIERMDPVAD